MANKPYITLKKANEVLSLYGIRIIKKLEWDGVASFYYHYAAIRASDYLFEWSWEATKIYIPNDRKTNMERVEYVLENLERLK